MQSLFNLKHKLRLLSAVLAVSAMPSLTGCAAVVIGAVSASAVTVSEDGRTVGTQIDDTTVESRVAGAIGKDKVLKEQTNINVHVFNGAILLVGQAPTSALIQQAESIALGVENVSNVYNQIRDGNPTATTTRAHDVWLASKVRANLLTEKEIDFLKMNVAVEDSEVFLMGIVTQAEADKAIEITRNLDGVVKVINVFDIAQ